MRESLARYFIITVENQGTIFSIRPVHERGKLKHFKKLVFHSEVTIERMDLIIQQLQSFRKEMFEGEGIKKALREAV